MRLSGNVLHRWKDISMLVKPLAACSHLSSTVSQLFEPQVQKSPFSRTAAHIFISPGDAPAIITQYVAWMERQFDADLTITVSEISYPPCIRRPSEYRHPLWDEKLEWCRYPMVKKFRRYVYSF